MYSFLCIIQNVYSLIMTYCKVEKSCTIKHTCSCVYCYYTINLDKGNCILLSKKHYCSCKPSRSGQKELKKKKINATLRNQPPKHCTNDSEHKMNHCVRTILL
jgi:hypothetical protein